MKKQIKPGIEVAYSLYFKDTLGRSWEYPVYKVQSLRSDPVSPGFVQVIIRNDNQENLFVCDSKCADRELEKLREFWDAIGHQYVAAQGKKK
jgi:hypothetical protein